MKKMPKQPQETYEPDEDTLRIAQVIIDNGGTIEDLESWSSGSGKNRPVYGDKPDGSYGYAPPPTSPGSKEETEDEYWARVAREAAQSREATQKRVASDQVNKTRLKLEEKKDYNYNLTHPSGPHTPKDVVYKLKLKYGLGDDYLPGKPAPLTTAPKEEEPSNSLLD